MIFIHSVVEIWGFILVMWYDYVTWLLWRILLYVDELYDIISVAIF